MFKFKTYVISSNRYVENNSLFLSEQQLVDDDKDGEEEITETTVMLELEEDGGGGGGAGAGGRAAMSRIEYWARGGLQDACGDAGEMFNQVIILLSFVFMAITLPFSLFFAIKCTQVAV